jgi:hypothetical protein
MATIHNRNSSTDRCLMLDLASSRLALSNCEQKHNLVCKVRTLDLIKQEM